jgi:hypothetical protein
MAKLEQVLLFLRRGDVLPHVIEVECIDGHMFWVANHSNAQVDSQSNGAKAKRHVGDSAAIFWLVLMCRVTDLQFPASSCRRLSELLVRYRSPRTRT